MEFSVRSGLTEERQAEREKGKVGDNYIRDIIDKPIIRNRSLCRVGKIIEIGTVSVRVVCWVEFLKGSIGKD